MIGCQIFGSTKSAYTIYAYVFYYNTNERNRFFPIWEGEIIQYDVSLLINREKFIGYTWSLLAKYIEYFRAIDGCKYHSRYHLDILNKIQKQIRDERYIIR